LYWVNLINIRTNTSVSNLKQYKEESRTWSASFFSLPSHFSALFYVKFLERIIYNLSHLTFALPPNQFSFYNSTELNPSHFSLLILTWSLSSIYYGSLFPCSGNTVFSWMQ
jgi:hypothetical protein